MNRPVIAALGVSHRDVDLATLWLRWVKHLNQQTGVENYDVHLLVTMTTRITPVQIIDLANAVGICRESFKPHFFRLPDDDEAGYPRSASHLFLRTLEMAERHFPGHAVLWCEADTVPTRPTWFREIVADYQTCGQPFMGVRIGDKPAHMSGVAVYAANWRKLAPSFETVLDAPDQPAIWAPGKGQAWDIWTRREVVPQMAETKTIRHVWKHRDVRVTRLKDIPPETALFHQDKTGALIREIARANYPDFMDTLTAGRRYFKLMGHKSRLKAKGYSIRFSFERFLNHGWTSAVCDTELTEEDASTMALLVGKLGITEISEADFLALTGRKLASVPERRKASPRSAVTAVATASHPSVFVMLGRYGDIMNLLPLLKAEADAGRRPTLVVSKDFADIIDGVSYVDRIVWDGAYDALPEALRWLRASKGIHAPVVAQYHRHPTDKARLTDSFQKECWRLAGRLDQFDRRGPLTFDRRDLEREMKLKMRHLKHSYRPLVLVGLQSVSSPLPRVPEIKEAIRVLDGIDILDLEHVKAEYIFDLIALFNEAACLVTADTAFVHLARASKVPVLALLNNGWRGSVAEHAAMAVRYDVATPSRVADGLRIILKPADRVVVHNFKKANDEAKAGALADEKAAMVRAVNEPATGTPCVIHVVDTFGTGERHRAAKLTWERPYARGVIPLHINAYPRDAKTELGDPRRLPFLKDLLKLALHLCENDHDIIIWGNSDIALIPETGAAIREYMESKSVGAISMRRTESNGEHHMGRDLFAFTAGWLRKNWDELPDYVIGAPFFDLGLAAMIRTKAGITTPSTKKNMNDDFEPADMPPGLALHESHRSEWVVRNMNSVPSIAHNTKLFFEWAQKHAPEMKFSKGKALL